MCGAGAADGRAAGAGKAAGRAGVITKESLNIAAEKGMGFMELLTSVLVAGGVCVCVGAIKAICKKISREK